MKKQLRALWAAALCLAALAGAWLFLAGGEETPETGSKMKLLDGEKALLARVEVTGASGGYRAEYRDGALAVEGLEGLPLDSSACSRLISSAVSLDAVQEVEDGGTRLADFGLEEPLLRVEVSAAGGTRTAFSVGNEVPGSAGRYVLKDGVVYTAHQSGLTPFFFSAEDFLSKQVTPDLTEAGLTAESVSISGRSREEPLVLALTENRELADYQVNSYYIRSPLAYPADPSRAEELLDSVFGLTAESVAAVRPGEGRLADFGLEDPWARLELSYRNGGGEAGQTNVSFSQPDASGMSYALADGLPVVYAVRTEGLYWTALPPEELVSREVLAPSVYRLEALTVERPEGVVSIALDWDEDRTACRVSLGELELDWDSFRNFYYTLVGLSAGEVLFGELPDTAEMEWLASVTFSLGEDGQETAVYYRESGRRVYAEAGGRGCRLAYTQLSQMLERLDRLASGETVEARY